MTDPGTRLAEAWTRSDELFASLREDSLRCQPIRLRQPLLFYVGHLPAFAWNQLGRGVLGRAPFAPDLDALFERGIDPEDEHDPGDAWPAVPAVLAYRDRVRAELLDAVGAIVGVEGRDGRGPGDERLLMVLEHELMHHETLLYMLARMEEGRVAARPAPPAERAVAGGWVDVPAGTITIGTPPGDAPFAWDNERPAVTQDVAAFRLEASPVTNRAFLEFVADGGYLRPESWRPRAWEWVRRAGVEGPASWTGAGAAAPEGVRVPGGTVPFDVAGEWPASVSHAEAEAYAAWRGRRLPTEAEIVRARGDAAPAGAHLGFDRRHPRAAGAADDVSAFGVRDAWGNGWEWTSSLFGPLAGFAAHPAYPGYSADFFDGRHYVLRGGSWATARQLARPGFRNWFQPHYPYVFSKFRCASDA